MKTQSGWSDATKESVFRNAADRPKTWFVKGCHLRKAADGCDWIVEGTTGIAKNDHVAFVHMMLLAMAIEALLKAMFVRRKGSPLEPSKNGGVKLTRDFKTHDLRKLAALGGLSISAAEESLLDRLALFVKWFGRYPVPIESNLAEQVGVTSDERSAALRFYDRLHGLLEPDPMLNDLAGPRVP
jgi:hypothetical protein